PAREQAWCPPSITRHELQRWLSLRSVGRSGPTLVASDGLLLNIAYLRKSHAEQIPERRTASPYRGGCADSGRGGPGAEPDVACGAGHDARERPTQLLRDDHGGTPGPDRAHRPQPAVHPEPARSADAGAAGG